MFTGIIEELGMVERLEPNASGGARLRVGCSATLSDMVTGASIAVNGVCLTALDIDGQSFSADLAPETLHRSNLGGVQVGSRVNLERPLLPTSRLSGHIVQGHVDGVGELVSLEPLGDGNWWLRLRVPDGLERYIVAKGSVALDGISLTIAALEGDQLSIAVIPHTYEATTLRSRAPGDLLNVECDILAKHVERLIAPPFAAFRTQTSSSS